MLVPVTGQEAIMLPISPAVILRRQVGRDIAAFSRATRIPYRLLNAVLSGKRRICWPVACRLGRTLRTGPWYWLMLQDRYEAAVAPALRFSARRGQPAQHLLSLMPRGT